MTTGTKPVYLTVRFRVREGRWIRDRSWIGEGDTARARLKEFDDELYTNLSALLATVIGERFWECFQGEVVAKLLPNLSNEGGIEQDHLGSEFWEGVNVAYQASVTCELLDRFSQTYKELKTGLLEELEALGSDYRGDEWSYATCVLLTSPVWPVSVTLAAGTLPLVFGEVELQRSVEVTMDIELPNRNRLEYELDGKPADLDDLLG